MVPRQRSGALLSTVVGLVFIVAGVLDHYFAPVPDPHFSIALIGFGAALTEPRGIVASFLRKTP